MIRRHEGSVQTYSMRRHRNMKVSEHFKVKEFASHDGADAVLISRETVALLEQVRAYYRAHGFPKATITINSGYRTRSWNRRIGGASRSQHVFGRAADFVVRIPNGGIVSPYRVYDDINRGLIFGRSHVGGLGRYRSFTHIDTGPNRRWIG